MRRSGISAPRYHYLDGYNGWQLAPRGKCDPADPPPAQLDDFIGRDGISIPRGGLPAVELARPVRDPTPPRGFAFDEGGRAFAGRADVEPDDGGAREPGVGLCDLPGNAAVDPLLAPALEARITGLALGPRGRLYVAVPARDELRILRLSPAAELAGERVKGILSVAVNGGIVHVLARGAGPGTSKPPAPDCAPPMALIRSSDADSFAVSPSGALAAVSSRGDFIDFSAAGSDFFQRIALGRRTLPAIAFGAPDATGAETLYVGDQQSGRIVRYRIDAPEGGSPTAAPLAWSQAIGAFAALAWRGKVLQALDAGCRMTPIDFEADGFHATSLTVYIGPLDGQKGDTEWHRIVAAVDLPDTASVLVSTFASDDCRAFDCEYPDSDERWSKEAALVSPVPPVENRPDEATLEACRDAAPARPQRPSELALQGVIGRYLFVRLRLTGDGRTTPLLRWLRAEYPRRSYLRYLPSIYSQKPESADLTARFLSIFEAENVDLAREIADLRRLFAPLAGDPELFPWLAEHIGVLLDPSWSIEKQRQVLSEAMTLYRGRGTRRVFERFLELHVGDGVRVVEGFRGRAAFITGPAAVLGCTTVLPGGCEAPRAQLDRGVRLGRARLDSRPFPEADALIEHRGELLIYLPPALSDDGSAARAELIGTLEAPAGTTVKVIAGRSIAILGHTGRLGLDASLGRRAAFLLPLPGNAGATASPLPLLINPDPGAAAGVRVGVGSRLGMGTRL
jgi:phage tail-like protein